jgi:hypothetical protein
MMIAPNSFTYDSFREWKIVPVVGVKEQQQMAHINPRRDFTG